MIADLTCTGKPMLNFFRTYQKYFFILITVAVVVSFLFFGTYSAMGSQEIALPDKKIGLGVCGKPLMQQELASLTRLIGSSPFDGMAEKGGIPNLLNDGVVEKDFLSTGLGVMLA